MAHQASIRRHVRFVETDAAGIVHYSNFFRFMEEAEIVFWKSIKHVVHAGGDCGTISWPRVEANCQFINPLKFDDEFEVKLRVAEKREKTLVFTFHINKLNGPEPVIVARGRIVCVCVQVDRQTNAMKSIPIPPDIAELIDAPAKSASDHAPTKEA